MSVKIFIGYSHKDEEYRNDLVEHLSVLSRNNVISTWHDRKITAGTEWEGQIDQELSSADIVLFLISSSFLASDYCLDIEVQQAFENSKAGRCHVVPVLVRPCDWKDTPFSKLQSLPENADPITKWNDKDDAWLHVIDGIKTLIANLNPKPRKESKGLESPGPKLSSETYEWLEDTEITFSHRAVSVVKLEDVFVVPDVEFEDAASEVMGIKSAQTLLEEDAKYLIAGEEQQGKTTLLKYLYKQLLSSSSVPIYLDCSKIKTSNLKKLISNAVSNQYEDLTLEQFTQFSDRAVLLDNFEKLSLNSKHRSIFLNELVESFNKSYITCHDTFSYVKPEVLELDSFNVVELLCLGHRKREELTKKWLCIGREESIPDAELYERCDEVKMQLNQIIKRNLVPSKPLYMLMLLQMFEANTKLNTELTSYGHCYQMLIYQSFENARLKPTDFEKYLNVLAELAWWILENKKNPNSHDLDQFFILYNRKYIPIESSEIIKKLTSHSILEIENHRTGFKYPYIFYFFTAKKIAESYQDSDMVRERVKEIFTQIHREDYANILIFITHHSKDSWVLEDIKRVLNSSFEECSVASLDRPQMSFMEKFIQDIPDLVIEQREIQKERDSHNARLDSFERDVREDDVEGDLDPRDILADINKTFKGMEVAGQIIRNRHASLESRAIVDLAGVGIESGLRFLDFFISISDIGKQEIVNHISYLLGEGGQLSDQQIKRNAETTYLNLTFGVISGVIRKIASSIGSKEALLLYSKIEEQAGTPAATLIRLSIELQFNRRLRIDSVQDSHMKLKDNSVCLRILKEMVVQHIYMFPVDYKVKQQLSGILDLSVQGQRMLDLKKDGKG